ncbi:PTS sugar transporter subunit IIC [Streptobacillus canis]|uniref:PTS sugar transporter subunit IIC n=1 Tax=Streptobacillus canis TaxID=2678686 RepID=UPI0012E0DE67|nr:PTS sugar transporter subunit IIC [Streptobacillus canis]
MKKLAEFLDKHLSTPMAKLAEQRHFRAIRDGIVATLPIIIVGSFFLILAFPPLPASWKIVEFIKANIFTILLPYRMSMYIMTLYAVFGIGYSLSKSYKLDGLSGGILATLSFLLTIVPVNVTVDGAGVKGLVIPMSYLGSVGMFVGIITSILAVEIYRLIDKSGFKIKMPDQVPKSVAQSFANLTPTAVIIILMGSITYFLKFDWHAFVGKLVAPLVSAADSYPSVVLLVFLITFFWSFGIHGVSIVGSLARPVWLILLEQNTNALAAGQPLPAIAAEPFYQWFIWIGGSGCTIGLAILLAFRARSSYAKSLGKTVITPSIFNINEPVIFGCPIVLNPQLIVPFIAAPVINATIAYVATAAGLVSKVSTIAPWTLPGPIGAYLATGGDYRAAILNVLLIGVSVVVYYPFFKMYDNKLLAEEGLEA